MRTFHLGENLVVVSPLRDAIVMLNPTASWIWELLAQGEPPNCVALRLAGRFDIGLEVARKDVNYVEQLRLSSNFPMSANLAFKPDVPPGNASLENDRQAVSERYYRLSKTPFLIRYHSAEVESILQSVLGHLEDRPSASSCHVFEVLVEDDGYSLHKEGVEVAKETSPHSLRHTLVSEIAKISYPETDWLIFMHAAAVGKGGRCVVLPGLPRCGKSTLTAALIHSGFQYLSEDIVPLSRRDLTALPVPARICLRDGGRQALRKEFPCVEALAGGHRWGGKLWYVTPPGIKENPPSRMPVQCVVFPEYKPGDKTALSRISSEEMMARIIQTGAWFSDPMDDAKIEALLGWIQSTPGYQLCFANLTDAVSLTQSLLKC